MERAEVEMGRCLPVLSYRTARGKAIRAARFVNDQYAALVQRHRDRYRAFAALPMPHPR
jgi:aminocarboxymuconate-semialdehyde decarboxylase